MDDPTCLRYRMLFLTAPTKTRWVWESKASAQSADGGDHTVVALRSQLPSVAHPMLQHKSELTGGIPRIFLGHDVIMVASCTTSTFAGLCCAILGDKMAFPALAAPGLARPVGSRNGQFVRPSSLLSGRSELQRAEARLPCGRRHNTNRNHDK